MANKYTKLINNPKFIARYTLGLFVLSTWVYDTLITGSNGIADFSTISDEVFNDKMFYTGAYQQLCSLVADINNPSIIQEMVESKTFLLDRKKLKEMLNINESKMKSLAEAGVSIYSMLVAKKLAEQTVFDEYVTPTEYTVIDGSDKSTTDITVPLSFVFSIESALLDTISDLLDLKNKTIVSKTIAELQKDPKLTCFKDTFTLLSKLDTM